MVLSQKSDTLLGWIFSRAFNLLCFGLSIFNLLFGCLGNTYPSSLNPLFILQKKIVRLITFSHYKDHTNPLFINLKIVKLRDLVFLLSATFMYNFQNNNLPDFLIPFFWMCNIHTTRGLLLIPHISFRISGLIMANLT